MCRSYFSEVNSYPWDVPDFNATKLRRLMLCMCTTFAILAPSVQSALPEKFNCAQE